MLKMPRYWENKISHPSDVLSFLGNARYLSIEHFYLIFVDKDRNVSWAKDFAEGTEINCKVDIRKLCKLLTAKMPVGLIIAHNHPNGDMQPSSDDNNLTAHVTFMCESLGIQLLDHVIVGCYGYYSYAESNLKLLDSKKFLKVAEL